jgi:aspartyl-tRNA(Asn)/glutamyl-tRNA(Gln) amidotransferase subunit C
MTTEITQIPAHKGHQGHHGEHSMPFVIKQSHIPSIQLFLFIMIVNDALVEKLAKLAHLHFDESEKENIKADLQKMIAFIDKLNEIDTTGVEPLLHMSENTDHYREDVVQGTISREEALKNAPDHDGSFFRVPKVINK